MMRLRSTRIGKGLRSAAGMLLVLGAAGALAVACNPNSGPDSMEDAAPAASDAGDGAASGPGHDGGMRADASDASSGLDASAPDRDAASHPPDAGGPGSDSDSSLPNDSSPGSDGGSALPDAGNPGSDGGISASDGGPSGHYQCGYPCDPISNTGCPSGQGCLLTSTQQPDNTYIETVSCVPLDRPVCVDMDYASCGATVGGRFYAGECSVQMVAGFTIATCQTACDRSAARGSARGCDPTRTCVPSSNGCYGFCEGTIGG